ncbi:hypothetical protein KGF54_003747 [Candida jiufengensis]|uniref:uncharacterized protein n=1 Tax=Candida jiufengensis TaxID=497108 RepID=UPI002224CDB2|nr:uncharacterized protein KGF54_003747 [Candida jiufengensis]KAI5952880.1 hypothetical protein KGF54_003747 [Candida jiufengensis]
MTNYERINTQEDDSNLLSDSQLNSNILIDSDIEENETTNTSPSTTSQQQPTSSSSSNPISSSSLDLESQIPPRLTPKQRIIRVFNHLFPLKQTYERLNNGIQTGRMQHNAPGRFIGQGTDGVFQNLMAKPDTLLTIQQREAELHPPTYEEAAQDASPEYWESTMISPMYEDEVFVQGLPVGNIANFIWNGLVTIAFQFIGFILCYLLHTSHAAKQGSRMGLGINLIMYGWNILPLNMGSPKEIPKKYIIDNPNDFNDIDKHFKIESNKIDNYSPSGFFIQDSNNHIDDNYDNYNTTPYIAYGLISFGLFIVLKSIVDFYKVKQLERSILRPNGSSNSGVTQSATNPVENHNEQEENNESPQGTEPNEDPTEMR